MITRKLRACGDCSKSKEKNVQKQMIFRLTRLQERLPQELFVEVLGQGRISGQDIVFDAGSFAVARIYSFLGKQTNLNRLRKHKIYDERIAICATCEKWTGKRCSLRHGCTKCYIRRFDSRCPRDPSRWGPVQNS